ncbi:MAG: S24/S26 family peptidase [Oscillospiraceae bacterium]|jgi:hypothetical protein|nr:S24/S26 family peptidase [Oscillospiraceae bacterium]
MNQPAPKNPEGTGLSHGKPDSLCETAKVGKSGAVKGKPALSVVRQTAPLAELAPFMTACMEEGHAVRFTVRGDSMLPFLVSDRDAVTLVKAPERLKKGDVPLYLRDSGKYVLHRVISIENGVYTMRGDNQEMPEPGIRHDQIIGLAVAFERGGKEIACKNPGYRFVTGLWRKCRMFRVLVRRARRLLRKFRIGKCGSVEPSEKV